jgi:putative ABC transport system substrate-binding protein
MRRRDFIVGLLCAAPVELAQAQQKAQVYRIAVVHQSERVGVMSETGSFTGPAYSLELYRAFFLRLRQLGRIEGQNFSVARYSGQGRTEHFAELAREVVRGKPDLIFVNSSRLTPEIEAATDTIPVVSIVSDPVAWGIVSSLARPGGDVTGSTVDAGGVEIIGKLLDLLREMVPTASRVAWLASPAVQEIAGAALREAAQRMKISIVGPPLDPPFEEAEYRRVFEAMMQEGVDALVVDYQTQNFTNRRLIVGFAEKARIPAIYPSRVFAEVGGLITYGVDPQDLYRHAAEQVDQVLNGTKPSDIPFYQPTKLELVINLKTAKALGITVPPSLLATADEVIE